MDQTEWQDLGKADDFKKAPLTEVTVGREKIAISFKEGEFGAVSGVCNHVGGPLAKGTFDGEYIVCPWHNWRFHRKDGVAKPPNQASTIPSYELRVENGHLFIRIKPLTERKKINHPVNPVARPVHREEGPVRVVGISATAMDRENPRCSTSEALLNVALEFAASELGCQTKLIKLDELKFRNCEGYYSKSARACTWPCSITQMDPKDEMDQVYEALVHWSDVMLLATPIRWGSASSLFFKMAERLNCVQNQITIADKVLIQNKIASFIIVGGQDNIQQVAGHCLDFFSELGFYFPQFPYIAHSRGWSAEDMERNVAVVMKSEELHQGSKELVRRAVEMAKMLICRDAATKTTRGGRKAHELKD